MPDDLTRLRLEQASGFASAILDARLRHERASWAPWIAQAQHEAAPLGFAVLELARRSLALAEPTGPTVRAETGLGGSTEKNTSNGHESVTRSSTEIEPSTRSRGPRIGRSPGLGEAQVRGMLAERVILSTELDPFLSLAALAAYSGLSVRNLRERLTDPAHPLPCYRVGGKVLVRRSDYDAWALRHRRVGAGPDVDRLVAEVLRELR
jgi:hypothetical protein